MGTAHYPRSRGHGIGGPPVLEIGNEPGQPAGRGHGAVDTAIERVGSSRHHGVPADSPPLGVRVRTRLGSQRSDDLLPQVEHAETREGSLRASEGEPGVPPVR